MSEKKPRVTYEDLKWLVRQFCRLRQPLDARYAETPYFKEGLTPTIARIVKEYKDANE